MTRTIKQTLSRKRSNATHHIAIDSPRVLRHWIKLLNHKSNQLRKMTNLLVKISAEILLRCNIVRNKEVFRLIEGCGAESFVAITSCDDTFTIDSPGEQRDCGKIGYEFAVENLKLNGR
jgi:hypothetical protein